MNKEVKKMAFVGLNKIYKNSRDIAKAWQNDYVPLNTLKEVCESCKLTLPEGVEYGKEVLDMQTDFNNMVDSIYKACDEKAKEYESSVVNLKFLKMVIELVKKTINEVK